MTSKEILSQWVAHFSYPVLSKLQGRWVIDTGLYSVIVVENGHSRLTTIEGVYDLQGTDNGVGLAGMRPL